jgi:tRNA-Thr(GGU) m(6)t(6)A37 methyltransferase TsaA
VDRPPDDTPATLTLAPIGYVRSPFSDRAEAPRQPRAGEGVEATIELLDGHGYDRAVSDLEGWEFLWVLFWFHKNAGWRPMVLPPRSDRRRGVFSTRSPHRPNPLGLSLVRLLSVSRRSLRIAGCDMLDGTPVFDLKPYVPWSDAVPHARTGWLAPPEHVTTVGEDGRPDDPKRSTEVRFAPLAREQLDWLAARGAPEVEANILRALSLGPAAHPYRRIQRDGAFMKLAVKAWRARFRVEPDACTVLALTTGYRAEALADEPGPELDLHREFVRAWGREFPA